MAFFTSPQQEVYEQRLKRSPSNTSVRARPRYHPSGTSKSLLTSRSDVLSRPLPSSPTAPPVTTPVPVTSPNVNEPDHGM